TESYSSLFIFATLGNFVAIILAVLTWRILADRNTTLLDATPKQFRLRQVAGIGILIGTVPVVWLMLQRPGMTETVIKGICGAVAVTLIYLTLRHSDRREQRNMTAYLILTIGSLMFWSLYQMAPSGLMLFAVNNVDLMVGPVKIQPQWIQNINTVCIVLGGPVLASLFTRDFSGMIPEPTGTTAVATTAGYAKLFAELGAGSLAVGIVLVVLIPFLRKLITDKTEAPIVEAATVVPVA